LIPSPPHIIVLITVPSAEVGQTVADALLAQRLAACVNIVPAIRSLYLWQGQVADDQESLLIVKSRAALFEQLAAVVRAVHPYEVPEIIALPIVLGSPTYLQWLDNETSA
jgi:periplasmic divalent cation tolerance protein